jgi:hypothetical protein
MTRGSLSRTLPAFSLVGAEGMMTRGSEKAGTAQRRGISSSSSDLLVGEDDM